MFSMCYQLPWLGIAAASAASFIVGSLWFTVLFGKPYMNALGKKINNLQKLLQYF
jgi:hypothetical protein